MKINIKNLGVVKDATIDLSKKLTVFCGENGTGKTYVSYLIYGIFAKKDILHNSKLYEFEDKESKKEILDLELEFNSLDIENKVTNTINKQDYLSDIFNISNKFFKETVISFIDFSKYFKEFSFEYNFELNQNTTMFIKKEIGVNKIISHTNKTFEKNSHFNLMMQFMIMHLFKIVISKTFILPVERSAIHLFDADISVQRQQKLDELAFAKNRDDIDITQYPLAIRIYLYFSQQLKNIRNKQESKYDAFAKAIEDGILNGKIEIDEYGMIQFTSNRNKKLKLNFNATSSIVKNLAGLVIYLRYQAQENDLIIIDEPELNLHPSNQILLARIFAKLINAGLRLVISTHSDYIIRELNNLIMIGNDNNQDVKETAKTQGYNDDEYLKESDIGAYLFKFKNKTAKSVFVEDIPIDAYGFAVETFDTEMKKLNNRTDEIYYSLKYGKE